MHVPLELRTGTVGRWRTYGVNMLVLMIMLQAVMPVTVTVSCVIIVTRSVVLQAVMPVTVPVTMSAMVVATRSVVLTHSLRLG